MEAGACYTTDLVSKTKMVGHSAIYLDRRDNENLFFNEVLISAVCPSGILPFTLVNAAAMSASSGADWSSSLSAGMKRLRKARCPWRVEISTQKSASGNSNLCLW